jgi:hypothetical protein
MFFGSIIVDHDPVVADVLLLLLSFTPLLLCHCTYRNQGRLKNGLDKFKNP